MSKDEKKSSLADLLEEYFPGAGQKAEKVLIDMFADGGKSSDEAEQTEETSHAKQISEVPAVGPEEEIITDDGIEDDTFEVSDEPFEIPEDGETEKSEDFSALSGWSDWADKTIAENAAVSGTFNETEAAEEAGEAAEIENASEDTAESDASEEEQDASEEASESSEKEEISKDEDINEKWLARFAKSIFPVKGDSVFEVIRKIIFFAAIIVFIGAGIMLASTLIQSKKALEIQSSMRDIIETTVATYIDEDGNTVTVLPTPDEIAEHNKQVAENIKEINDDYVGFLEIEGCDIYEPVVKGEDNVYYLKNNIYGEPNKAGAIFMDYRCIVSEEYTSPNIVIYGHNQEDGTMFGRLKYYKADIDFYSKHPVIKFNPEFESSEYLIYAFFVTNALENQDSNGEVFHYHDYIETMNDEYTFNWYQGEVQKRNQIISPIDVKYGDQLLVLSTCSNEFTESRFVVFARKLREGESVSDYDFSNTYFNPNAQGVDWEAIMSGETTATTAPEAEEILEESTTRRKTLNKRNEKTYTTASEEETTVTEVTTEVIATVTTVPESETSVTETETAGSSENGDDSESGTDSETTVDSDETSGQTDESDTETSEVVTSKKNSNKTNR